VREEVKIRGKEGGRAGGQEKGGGKREKILREGGK
jgi:hypothetical protein